MAPYTFGDLLIPALSIETLVLWSLLHQNQDVSSYGVLLTANFPQAPLLSDRMLYWGFWPLSRAQLSPGTSHTSQTQNNGMVACYKALPDQTSQVALQVPHSPRLSTMNMMRAMWTGSTVCMGAEDRHRVRHSSLGQDSPLYITPGHGSIASAQLYLCCNLS